MLAPAGCLAPSTRTLGVFLQRLSGSAAQLHTDAAKQAEKYKLLWSADPASLISSASAAIATGDLPDAKQSLEKAARLIQKTGR